MSTFTRFGTAEKYEEKHDPYLFVYFLLWQFSAKLLSLFYTKLKYLKAETYLFRERKDSSFFGKLTESYLYVKMSKCFLRGKNINISGWEYSAILSITLQRDLLSTLVYVCWAIHYSELQNRRKEEKSLDNPTGSSNPMLPLSSRF